MDEPIKVPTGFKFVEFIEFWIQKYPKDSHLQITEEQLFYSADEWLSKKCGSRMQRIHLIDAAKEYISTITSGVKITMKSVAGREITPALLDKPALYEWLKFTFGDDIALKMKNEQMDGSSLMSASKEDFRVIGLSMGACLQMMKIRKSPIRLDILDHIRKCVELNREKEKLDANAIPWHPKDHPNNWNDLEDDEIPVLISQDKMISFGKKDEEGTREIGWNPPPKNKMATKPEKPNMREAFDAVVIPGKNYKSALLEIHQKVKCELPNFIRSRSGTDHDCTHHVQIVSPLLEGLDIKGEGSSIALCDEQACRKAIKMLKNPDYPIMEKKVAQEPIKKPKLAVYGLKESSTMEQSTAATVHAYMQKHMSQPQKFVKFDDSFYEVTLKHDRYPDLEFSGVAEGQQEATDIANVKLMAHHNAKQIKATNGADKIKDIEKNLNNSLRSSGIYSNTASIVGYKVLGTVVLLTLVLGGDANLFCTNAMGSFGCGYNATPSRAIYLNCFSGLNVHYRNSAGELLDDIKQYPDKCDKVKRFLFDYDKKYTLKNSREEQCQEFGFIQNLVNDCYWENCQLNSIKVDKLEEYKSIKEFDVACIEINCTETKRVSQRTKRSVKRESTKYRNRLTVRRDIDLQYQLSDDHKVLRVGGEIIVISPNEEFLTLVITKEGMTNRYDIKKERRYQISIPSEFLANLNAINYVLLDHNAVQVKAGSLPIDLDSIEKLASKRLSDLVYDSLTNHKTLIAFILIAVGTLLLVLYKSSNLVKVPIDALIALIMFPLLMIRSIMSTLVFGPMYTYFKYNWGEYRLFKMIDNYLLYPLMKILISDTVEVTPGFHLNGIFHKCDDMKRVVINGSGPYRIPDGVTKITATMGSYFYSDKTGKVRTLPLAYIVFCLLIIGASAYDGSTTNYGTAGFGSCSSSVIIPSTFTSCSDADKFCQMDMSFDTELEVGDTTCFSFLQEDGGINRTAHMTITVLDFVFQSQCTRSYGTGVVKPFSRHIHECANLFSHNSRCLPAKSNEYLTAQSMTSDYGEINSQSYLFPHVVKFRTSSGGALEGCFSLLDGCDYAEISLEMHQLYADVLICDEFTPKVTLAIEFRDKDAIGAGSGSWTIPDFVVTGVQNSVTHQTFTFHGIVKHLSVNSELKSTVSDTVMNMRPHKIGINVGGNYPNTPILLLKNESISKFNYPIKGEIGEIQIHDEGAAELPQNHKLANDIFNVRWVGGTEHSSVWSYDVALDEINYDLLIDRYKPGTVHGNYHYRGMDDNNLVTIGVNRFEAIDIAFEAIGVPAVTFAFSNSCPKIVELSLGGSSGCKKCAYVLLKAYSTCSNGDAHVEIDEQGYNVSSSDYRVALSNAEIDYKLPITVNTGNANICVKITSVGHEDKKCASYTFADSNMFSINGNFSYSNNTITHEDEEGGILSFFDFISTGWDWLNSTLRVGLIVLCVIGGLLIIGGTIVLSTKGVELINAIKKKN